MRKLRERVRAAYADVPAGERRLVLGAMALSGLVVVVFVIAHRHAALRGDEISYDQYGNFFADGKWWWSSTVFPGYPHPSAWKVPFYPAWMGLWYGVFGLGPTGVEAVQGLVLAPLTVLLGWALARRLFGPRVAVWTAFIVAVFPLTWEYIGLLYPEAFAVPLMLAALLLVLDRTPTVRLAALIGLLIGLSLLVRPNSFVLLPVAATAWTVASGWRRGLSLTVLATVAAVIVVAPWTIRNALTDDVGFIPLSVQDAAIYGTFNSEAASDPANPWAWRPLLRNPPAVLERKTPVSDSELRSDLTDFGTEYIRNHPSSLLKAFYWNGVRRFWDLQTPGDALDQVPVFGGSKPVSAVGLGMYYVLLPLALAGLWLARRRRGIVLPVIVLALTSSIVFTADATTRYRAPLEPLIAMFAVAGVAALIEKAQARRSDGAGPELTPTR